jgi:hypothetical protein
VFYRRVEPLAWYLEREVDVAEAMSLWMRRVFLEQK